MARSQKPRPRDPFEPDYYRLFLERIDHEKLGVPLVAPNLERPEEILAILTAMCGKLAKRVVELERRLAPCPECNEVLRHKHGCGFAGRQMRQDNERAMRMPKGGEL